MVAPYSTEPTEVGRRANELLGEIHLRSMRNPTNPPYTICRMLNEPSAKTPAEKTWDDVVPEATPSPTFIRAHQEPQRSTPMTYDVIEKSHEQVRGSYKPDARPILVLKGFRDKEATR